MFPHALGTGISGETQGVKIRHKNPRPTYILCGTAHLQVLPLGAQMPARAVTAIIGFRE